MQRLILISFYLILCKFWLCSTMADRNEPETPRQKYVKDPRIACKYGAKCYQKNPVHQQKYKHPPPKRTNDNEITQPKKKFKMDVESTDESSNESKANENEKIHIDETEEQKINQESPKSEQNTDDDTQDMVITPEKTEDSSLETSLGHTAKDFDSKDFIKEKFLVEMPKDFYLFWDFCKGLKQKCPQEALKDIGLTLVGPYDVLAGKFYDVPDQPIENYLIHWRYFHDPPEFQTVLKGDDRTGFHIGYFRDSPKEMPVYLASNSAKTNGVFKVMGENIFAAVNLYLEDLKKTGDPFKKMHIGKIQGILIKKAEELHMDLSEKTQKIKDRDKKIVTRSLSRMGIVIPYNRKTQLGYRDLGIRNKKLIQLFDNIQKASPDQKQKFLSDLQDVLTNVSIATDECDFGTGIELGLDIIAHGVDSINQTASRFLCTNYRLIGREEFAQIAEAHMKNRRKDTNLSII